MKYFSRFKRSYRVYMEKWVSLYPCLQRQILLVFSIFFQDTPYHIDATYVSTHDFVIYSFNNIIWKQVEVSVLPHWQFYCN